MKLVVAACVLAGTAMSQRVEVLVSLPGALGAEAEQALREELPAEFALRLVPAVDPAPPPPGSCRLLFGASEFQLVRLARDGALQRDAVPAALLPSRGGQAEGRYGLLLAMPYVLAFDARTLAAADVPRDWTGLATMSQLDDRLGLVAFDVDPVPWLAGMVHRLARGEGESAGFALWLALDARVGRYAGTSAELVAGLEAGTLAAAMLPEALCRKARSLRGLPPLSHRQLDDGVPVGLLGIAVQGGPVPPELAASIARLCAADARSRLAYRLGMQPVDAVAGPAPDWQRAEGWLLHFRSDIAGRGRTLHGLDQWLDVAFTIVFALFLLLVWSRLRRSERSEASGLG